jgi:ATP/maltotriose-dependent transcriptional regulator MalT
MKICLLQCDKILTKNLLTLTKNYATLYKMRYEELNEILREVNQELKDLSKDQRIEWCKLRSDKNLKEERRRSIELLINSGMPEEYAEESVDRDTDFVNTWNNSMLQSKLYNQRQQALKERGITQ